MFYATCTSNTKIYYTQNKICMLNGMKLKFVTVTVRLIITKVNQSAEVVLKAGLF